MTAVPRRATVSERYGLILSVRPCSSDYALEISPRYLHNISPTSCIIVTHLPTYHTVQSASPRNTASYLEAHLRSRLRPLVLLRLIEISDRFESLPELYKLHNDHTMPGGLQSNHRLPFRRALEESMIKACHTVRATLNHVQRTKK